MRPVKSVFGVLGAAVPVVWLGGLAYYFYRTNAAMGGLASKELMPVIVGLGVVGGLCAIGLLIKLGRIFSAGAAPASAPRIAGAEEAPASDFDAEAALARYMARKAAGEITPPPETAWQPAPRAGFGRKIS